MSDPTGTGAALAAALERGEMAALREAVRGLDAAGEEALAQRLGPEQVQRLRRSVRRARETARRAGGGRVVVVHGIMGARLDVVDAAGDSDRVWLNYWRLFNGRIGDLALDAAGQPADPQLQVRVAGMFPEYLPLLMELDGRWKVKPFAFDWRLDIDDSAAKLAETIRLWAGGQPCHVVAHSMGGLVARHMIARFPDLWASMRDPDGLRRGGRLVMLGTPNRGSFAIPMVLTGTEPVVRKLEALDRKHDMGGLLPILASFPGSYQMLPAPGSGSDDRDRLFTRAAWGALPAVEALLTRGRDFQRSLAAVVDGERMVYVAGYDQDTPYRIRIAAPGRFEYQLTRSGDGRVPHELGELPDVRTLWVHELHGDLPRNAAVLAGVHALLEGGNTVELEQVRPLSRARAPAGWVDALPEDESEALLGAQLPRRAPRVAPDEADAARAEALVLRGFVGAAPPAPAPAARAAGVAPPAPAQVEVEVVCGDITKIDGDVYCSGHYVGVLPQFAEAALDAVVSAPGAAEEERVLHALTARGVLRGDLGDVDLYPWADGSGRMVAIAGMGHPGSFGRSELQRLGYALALSLTALPGVGTACMVLIGSGTGNLPVRDAVEGMLLGAAQALRNERPAGSLRTVRLVELDLNKAREIRAAVEQLAADAALASTLKVKLLGRGVRVHASGRQFRRTALALSVSGLAAAAAARKGSAARDAAERVLASLPGGKRARAAALAHLAALGAGTRGARALDTLAGRVDVAVQRERAAGGADAARGWIAGDRQSTRFACVRDGRQLQVATLADTAVVPQRALRFDLSLFDELTAKATDPELERAGDLGALIGRLLIPGEFTPHLRGAAALVAELDRYTARLPWELLCLDEGRDAAPGHLAVRTPFARQLRTGYSPPPAPAPREAGTLRALVIGDPGDPRAGDDLPGARREALAVARFLGARGVAVDTRIGAPSAPRAGSLREHPPAGRLEVLELLLGGRYDLVHYCGHGDFDPQHPERTGWVFEDGLLTAREIERIARAPRLVVANACLSGRTSARLSGGGSAWQRGDESGLLPSLADEFFKRGVRDYVGTAWEVSDEGAITFASTLYEHLLHDGGDNTLGDALLAARKALHAQGDRYDALWAAYQHYGDPRQRLRRAGARAR